MKTTDRTTSNCESDYCMEFKDGTMVWIKDGRIVDCNDYLKEEQINLLLDHICKPLEEYKFMYEGLS